MNLSVLLFSLILIIVGIFVLSYGFHLYGSAPSGAKGNDKRRNGNITEFFGGLLIGIGVIILFISLIANEKTEMSEQNSLFVSSNE